MDHIYSVSRLFQTQVPSNIEWISDRDPIIAVSSRNTIAFTVYHDIKEHLASLLKHEVYVADLNMPWEPYMVTSHEKEIACLEWDITGTKLVIADCMGGIQLWGTKDFLLNEWTKQADVYFEGESIISVAYFHNGKKVGLNTDKKDSPYLLEKFQHIKFGPSLRQFGGRPLDGCIAISGSGKVMAIIQHLDGTIIKHSEILGRYRNRLKVVDICYAKNGDFLVVTSEGLVQSLVHCYRVALKVNQKTCTITCQPFSSFYLNCLSSNPEIYTKVTHLKFVLREAADAVVVCAAGSSGSCVEFWELREKIVGFHSMFLSPNSETKPKTTVGWQHHASHTVPMSVVSIATPRLSIYDVSPPPSYILVAYKDNTIKCLYRESLTQISSINVNLAMHKREEHGLKNCLTGTMVKNMQLTWTGCGLVAIDSLSQLFLYRLSPITDPGGPMTASYALTMLEYCLVTGTDCWDVILSLKPGIMESLCDKFNDTFNKQHFGNQMYMQHRYLAMKGSLFRCLSTGQSKVGDCHALIMLNSVSTALKSMLRPRDLSSGQDKGPAENLTAILTSKGTEIHMDKVFLLLEHKDFTVEPSVVQSLQHLTQWVAEFALYLLASIPQQYHSQLRFPGGGLITDPKALNTLRELLVIIRIWSFLNECCLPNVTKLYANLPDNVDLTTTIFKLLTKTLMSLGSEVDDTLIDDCCLLASQVIVPTVDLATNSQSGVSGPTLFLNSLPLQFEFGTEPEQLVHSSKGFQVDGTVSSSHQRLDIIRHINLGSKPSNYRQCTRCHSISLYKPSLRLPVVRAWDQRWIRNCPCYGHWKLCKQ